MVRAGLDLSPLGYTVEYEQDDSAIAPMHVRSSLSLSLLRRWLMARADSSERWQILPPMPHSLGGVHGWLVRQWYMSSHASKAIPSLSLQKRFSHVDDSRTINPTRASRHVPVVV
jgi:hypothetical protein